MRLIYVLILLSSINILLAQDNIIHSENIEQLEILDQNVLPVGGQAYVLIDDFNERLLVFFGTKGVYLWDYVNDNIQHIMYEKD